MKFLKFPQAQGALQIMTIDEITGKVNPAEMPFHVDIDPAGFCVVQVQLSDIELQTIKEDGGKFFIIYGPGSANPPIMQILTRNPFGLNIKNN